MKNKEIAVLFSRIADALEIKGEVGFKVLAYRKAARILEDLAQSPGEIRRMGGNALQTAGEYGMDVHVKRLIALYGELLGH